MTVAARRLVTHALARPRRDPAALVRWLGAVQAQDLLAARWALGVRLDGADEAAIERALDTGAIVRTHAMRGTWQMIAPEDVRWILALVAPRVIARSARRDAELGLDAVAYRKSRAALERALRDGANLTRAELAAVIARGGVATTGQRLSHLLARAELEGVIASGARRGKQTTHVLLDRIAPPAPVPPRDELIVELARRYFQSRAPATADDFAWWSGLSPADARAGHAAIAPEPDDAPARASATPHLLPAFDEYLVGYRDRDDVLAREHAPRLNDGGGLLAPCVIVGGRVVATWRRTLRRASVEIEVWPFDRVPDLTVAARRYAAFLGLAPELRITTSPRSSARSPRPRGLSSAGSAPGPRRPARSPSPRGARAPRAPRR